MFGGTSQIQILNCVDFRLDIEKRFELVILLDPEMCYNQNLDQSLWKCVHYQVIEMLRKQLSERDDQVLKDFILKLLDDVCDLDRMGGSFISRYPIKIISQFPTQMLCFSTHIKVGTLCV